MTTILILFSALKGLALALLKLPLLAKMPILAAGTMLTDEPFVKFLQSVGLVQSTANGGQLNPIRRIVAQVANYAVLASDGCGTLFTNRAAVGAVTFTLPAPTPAQAGLWFEFMGVADQTFTVAAPAGKVVALNNAAATSLACSTGSQKIGAVIRAYSDGTSWILQGSTIGVTYTVA